MNSFVEANEQTGIDFNTIIPKIREHTKTYSFFIYYMKSQANANSTHLQRLSFKLKQQKAWGWDKQDTGRFVQLFFIDLQNEQEVDQSFFDLKAQLLQSLKSKLIFYCKQYSLLQIINRAHSFGIDLSNSPIALYSPNVYPDLSQHLGWRQCEMGDISLSSSCEFETNVRKWMSSPGQKIDLWGVDISVDPQEGTILRLDPQSNAFLPIHQRAIKEYFLSYMSIGHHAQLFANYQTRKKQQKNSFMNKLIFNIQTLKKFCCIGKPSLESSTGIVSVVFHDEKGYQQQISKEIRGEQGKRGIMTLLLSNIDRFQGMKLDGGRISDSKLEIGVFESSNGWRLISASNGQINMQLKAQQIFMQVNSTCLRLMKARRVKVKLQRKVKVLINKDTLEC